MMPKCKGDMPSSIATGRKIGVVITISGRGYIKRQPLTAYRQQHRGGKGVRGIDSKPGTSRRIDVIEVAHCALGTAP